MLELSQVEKLQVCIVLACTQDLRATSDCIGSLEILPVVVYADLDRIGGHQDIDSRDRQLVNSLRVPRTQEPSVLERSEGH